MRRSSRVIPPSTRSSSSVRPVSATTASITSRVWNAVDSSAAYAAGLATGVWSDLDELRSHWREDVRFEPQMPEDERERRYRQWRKAVSKSLDWVDDDARVLMGTTGD